MAPEHDYGRTAQTIADALAEADALRWLSARFPCHAMVRPPGVRAGAVFDALAPIDPAARQAARAHYRTGGIVRFHARRPSEFAAAAMEICT
jgi:hypothetical protein